MRRLGVSKRTNERAVEAAYAAQREFQSRLLEAAGRRSKYWSGARAGILLVGRSYNITTAT